MSTDCPPTGRVTTRVFLPATEPFDFEASLRFVRGFPAMVGEQDAETSVLRQAVRAGGQVLGVRLHASGRGPGLDAELESDRPLPDAVRDAVADRVSFQFGLADDLAGFYALAAGDPPFARIVERLHGYHQVKFPSPLELLVWAILGQRVPMPVARSMKRAIMTACGNEVTVDGHELRAFPDLDQLRAFDEPGLLALIGNTRKAHYLHGSIERWADVDEAFLRHGDHDAVREWLLGLPGVGPWSATFLLIRGLGRTERMTADREALRAASRVYGHPVDEAEFQQLAARYGERQGYWGHYLRVA